MKDIAILVTEEGSQTFTDGSTFQKALAEARANEQLNRPIVVDFHNVLDTVPSTTVVSPGIVCLSFVKRTSHYMRQKTTRDILARIKTKQIRYGVIVFERGKGNDVYTCSSIGSKAWFCQLVNAKIFIDDSLDHVASVSNHCKKTNTILIRQGHITKKESQIAALCNIVESITVHSSLQHCFSAVGEKRDDRFNKHEKRFKRFCENNVVLSKAGFRVESYYPCSEQWRSHTHGIQILPMFDSNYLYLESNESQLVGGWCFKDMRELQAIVKDVMDTIKQT